MSAPTLFETAFDNRGLFSDHYLENRFPERADVQALQEEADEAFQSVRDRYQSRAEEAENWNEAQTEDKFIKPILEDVLGWSREVQPHVQKQGRAGRPDYALFTTEERRATAVRRADGDETKVFNYADAVADAKYWGRPLDGPAPDPTRERRAEMRRNNPSFQIIDYVTLTGVDWGILTNGARWRLYYEGAPSRLETYFEVHLPEIMRLAAGDEQDQEAARHAFHLFYALFRADAHRPTIEGEKFVDVVYEASDTYAETLEDTLKERVFDHVFLELATGLYENHDRRNGDRPPDEVLNDVYRATLRLLYRLLFLLYAESRGLLPLDNPGYYDHSLTRLAQRAKDAVAGGRTLSRRHTDFWNDLDALFQTIDEGDPAFDVPAYNGGLFRQENPENHFLDSHAIGQKYVAHALVNLTAVDPEGEPAGPSVDYTSLDVRQLGSIYEGLLEHRLVLDDGDLDLQTDEGERKDTGSYYTPHYVVEYIVEETLGPIVDERIEQFEAAMYEINEILDGRDLDDPGVQAKLDAPRRQALDAFLTVRVCDPAMGSGHFLVYAADYLAERFGQILGRYPDHNPVTQRLEEIRQSILDELERQGVDTEGMEGDNRLRDTSLLKRLVMKRCIYGVDLNPMAVELAKLSLWLHSFTVGAPLSFLDHHLKAGNSLIGTWVDTVVEEIQADLFGNVRDEILRGTKFLQDAAFNTDATLADVEQSAEAFRTYQDTMRPYKRLLDLWTTQHFGHGMGRTLVRDYAREVIDAYKAGEGAVLEEHAETVEAAEALSDDKRVFHWELEFPEVFYELNPPGDRDNPGFDAVIGNPPWVNIGRVAGNEEMVSYSKKKFSSAEYQIDLYTLFLERGINLAREEGVLGMIVPDPWLGNFRTPKIRRTMLVENQPLQLMQTPMSAFPGVGAEHLIALIRSGNECQHDFQKGLIDEGGDVAQSENFECDLLREEDDYVVFSSREAAHVIKRVEQRSKELGTLYATVRGVGPYHHTVQEEDVIESRAYHADHKKNETFVPELKGKHLSRYTYDWDGDTWISYGEWLAEPREERFFNGKRLLLREILGERLVACVLDEEFVVDRGIYIALQEDQEIDLYYVLALVESALLVYWFREKYSEKDELFPKLRVAHFNQLPIREIDFTTDEDEREEHVNSLIDTYETARVEDTTQTEAAALDAVSDHLSADPERADVVHDLLAHLAREMTGLKAERATYHLDITDYVPAPSDDGLTLRDVGRYQPAQNVTDSLLADTAEDRDSLRVGRLEAERNGDTVHVSATARFKPQGDRGSWPDAVPDEAERDQWDYVETEPLAVCTLHDCTEIEAGLVVHWLDALNDADSGFSGYRDNATKTNSLLDRIYAARVPAPSEDGVQDALLPFLRNAQEAAELDRQIAFTDGLIDRVVYRLYGLSDEEVAVVEGDTTS